MANRRIAARAVASLPIFLTAPAPTPLLSTDVAGAAARKADELHTALSDPSAAWLLHKGDAVFEPDPSDPAFEARPASSFPTRSRSREEEAATSRLSVVRSGMTNSIGSVQYHLKLVARCSSLVAHRSSLVARRSSLVARRSPLVARRSSLVARRSSRVSLVTRRASRVARRSSLVAFRRAAHRSPLVAFRRAACCDTMCTTRAFAGRLRSPIRVARARRQPRRGHDRRGHPLRRPAPHVPIPPPQHHRWLGAGARTRQRHGRGRALRPPI